MHYGKKEKNPLDSVRFYSKLEPNRTLHLVLDLLKLNCLLVCREAGRGCYSNLRPIHFSEFLLRVYTKKTKFAEMIQEGYNAILGQLQQQYDSGVDNPDGQDLVVAREPIARGESPLPTTQMATEAPTTPKPSGSSGLHSRKPSYTFPVGTPFAPNEFTALRRSVSPMRSGTAPDFAPTHAATSLSPTPAPGKRKRAIQGRQGNESSQKTKKKR
jgi:hypothetical protein